MPLLFSSLPCLVASLKQQAKQKCCPYLVHLAMITVQVTREQPREEMTILLWAWRMENSNKEPPSLYHVPRHSGLFFCHTLYYPLSVQEALHVIHWMFGSEEHFWERMTWSEGRAWHVLYTAFFGLISFLEIWTVPSLSFTERLRSGIVLCLGKPPSLKFKVFLPRGFVPDTLSWINPKLISANLCSM